MSPRPRASAPSTVPDSPTPLTHPVARCVLDVGLAHLDRPFDYLVPPDQDEAAQPGCRITARFAGRLVDGFIVARLATSEAPGKLATLQRVVSSEPVLTPAVLALLRLVADHYAGSVADLLRLAVPPRHATTEKAPQRTWPVPSPQSELTSGLLEADTADGFLAALGRGDQPRGFWQVPPVRSSAGDIGVGVCQATQAALESGRSVLVLVPEVSEVNRLKSALTDHLGAGTVAVLHADLGPSARYRQFLAVLRGQARVLVGTRAAVFAPLSDLGLIVVVDEGSDLYSEPRAPYPHARDVAALRVSSERCGLLLASTARSCESQRWIERGWVNVLEAPRQQLRRWVAPVRVAGDSDLALERDPLARQVRLPALAFSTIRAGLSQGPVLVQVARRGYRLQLVCDTCREPVRCQHCHGPVINEHANTRFGSGVVPTSLRCQWCARMVTDWTCPSCEGKHWRAPMVGAERTAEELGRAFPGTRVIDSSDDHVVDSVSADPALVIATPGAEPTPSDGYAAAILLDTSVQLGRPDLRAGEEALRRWLAALSLVRSAESGGTVCVVGPPEDRTIQAMVRTDPGGFAERELAERFEARFPPAVKMVTVDGPGESVGEFADTVKLPPNAEQLGPVPLIGPRAGQVGGQREALTRLTLRAPLNEGAALVAEVRAALGVRSARKKPPVRVKVDPMDVA